jgi:hypothetical protein
MLRGLTRGQRCGLRGAPVAACKGKGRGLARGDRSGQPYTVAPVGATFAR